MADYRFYLDRVLTKKKAVDVFPTDGLISYWKFNSIDSGLIDEVGDLAGSIIGDVSLDDGLIENSYNFNGGYVRNVIDEPDKLSRANFFNDEVSFSTWLKPNSLSTSYIIHSAEASNTGTRREHLISALIINEKFNINVFGNDSSAIPISVNEWTHFAMTAKENGDIKVYKNGELEFSGTTNTGISNARYFSIGARSNGPILYTGNIDDTVMWNRLLTVEEIQTIYNLGAQFL